MRLDEGAQQAAVGVVQRHIVADHDGPCERPRLQVRQHVVHDVLEERQRVHAPVALGVSDLGRVPGDHPVDREHAERRPGAVRAQLEARAVLLLLARPPVPVLTIEVLVVLAAQARVQVSDGCCDEMDGVRTWSRR